MFPCPARTGWPWVAIAPGVAMKRALTAASAVAPMASLVRASMVSSLRPQSRIRVSVTQSLTPFDGSVNQTIDRPSSSNCFGSVLRWSAATAGGQMLLPLVERRRGATSTSNRVPPQTSMRMRGLEPPLAFHEARGHRRPLHTLLVSLLRQVQPPGAQAVRRGVEDPLPGHHRQARDLDVRHARRRRAPSSSCRRGAARRRSRYAA